MRSDTLFLATWSEGLDPDRNKDAVRAVQMDDGRVGVCAVADGASATLFSGEWASLLADAVVTVARSKLHQDELGVEVQRIGLSYEPPLASGNDGRWQRRKWDRLGSQSTLLAVRVEVEGPGRAHVEALAVGDSDLIIATGGSVFAFPVTDAAGFGRRPHLISSLEPGDIAFEHWSGSIRPGDVLIAASDGVARPLLEHVAASGPTAVFELTLGLLDHPQDAREALVCAFGSAMPDGTMSLEDDATLALCIFLPDEHPGDPADRARAVLREQLGIGAPIPSLLDRIRGLFHSWRAKAQRPNDHG